MLKQIIEKLRKGDNLLPEETAENIRILEIEQSRREKGTNALAKHHEQQAKKGLSTDPKATYQREYKRRIRAEEKLKKSEK